MLEAIWVTNIICRSVFCSFLVCFFGQKNSLVTADKFKYPRYGWIPQTLYHMLFFFFPHIAGKRITDRSSELLWDLQCADQKPLKQLKPHSAYFSKQHCTKKQSCVFQEYDIYHCSICNCKDKISQGNVSCIQHDLALEVGVKGLKETTNCCPCLKWDSDP